jgi:hypothetical protein
MADKLILFIPPWVDEARKRSKLSCEDLLDYEKARRCLSKFDMACFLRLQRKITDIIGVKCDDVFEDTLYCAWRTGAERIGEMVVLNEIDELLARSEDVDNEFNARLFQGNGYNTAYQSREDVPGALFIDYDACREFGMFVLYPSFFSINPGDTGALPISERRLALMRKILLLLTMYRPYNEVAKTKWFDLYLRLLN